MLSLLLLQDIDENLNGHTREEHSSEQDPMDPHCSIGSEEMPAHLNQEQYNAPRSVSF